MMQRMLFRPSVVFGIGLLMMAAAISEFSMGRQLWGTSGTAGLWSGDIWSNHNSQFLMDPYTFTHVTHGVLFYALLSIILNAVPVPTRLLAAVGLESLWEVMENTQHRD